MPNFRIEYRDPEPGTCSECGATTAGDILIYEGVFTDLTWAEDCAYSLAEKGWYNITEI